MEFNDRRPADVVDLAARRRSRSAKKGAATRAAAPPPGRLVPMGVEEHARMMAMLAKGTPPDSPPQRDPTLVHKETDQLQWRREREESWTHSKPGEGPRVRTVHKASSDRAHAAFSVFPHPEGGYAVGAKLPTSAEEQVATRMHYGRKSNAEDELRATYAGPRTKGFKAKTTELIQAIQATPTPNIADPHAPIFHRTVATGFRTVAEAKAHVEAIKAKTPVVDAQAKQERRNAFLRGQGFLST